MKGIHALPPLLALAIVGSTMAIQRRALATFEAETGRLSRQAAQPTAPDSEADLFPELEKRRSKQVAMGQELSDWVNLAEMMEKNNRGQGSPRALAAFEKRVHAMDNEELIARIEEIMNLDLTEDQQGYLYDKFLDVLMERDPELALRRVFGMSAQMDQCLASAWAKWSGSDTSAATVWLDEQIAAGKMDPRGLNGSDGCRGGFEGHLVKIMLASDPAAAARRIENLHPDLRDDVLWASVPGADDPTQKAWADLVRSQLPAKDALGMIARRVPSMEDAGNWSKAVDYMETISATPEERAACIQEVITVWPHYASVTGNITVEDIEALRTWADGQIADSSRNLTRDAIGAMLRNNQQSEMALESVKAIVAHYQAMEGGDEILVQALERSMNPNYKKDYVRALAAMIQEDERRAEILKKLEAQ